MTLITFIFHKDGHQSGADEQGQTFDKLDVGYDKMRVLSGSESGTLVEGSSNWGKANVEEAENEVGEDNVFFGDESNDRVDDSRNKHGDAVTENHFGSFRDKSGSKFLSCII